MCQKLVFCVNSSLSFSKFLLLLFCDAIAFKMYYPEIRRMSNEENLIYLFNWTKITEMNTNEPYKIPTNDNKKLIEFLKDEVSKCLGRDLGELFKTGIEFRENNSMMCYIVTRSERSFRCLLSMNSDKRSATITTHDLNAYINPLFEKNLIVRKQNKNLYIFAKTLNDQPIKQKIH
jgi:hypothetical protein